LAQIDFTGKLRDTNGFQFKRNVLCHTIEYDPHMSNYYFR